MTPKSSNGHLGNGHGTNGRPPVLPSASGLVIAGAAGKGSFAAGALSVIADRDSYLNIRNVVGTSSGALNAAVFAAGLAANKPAEAAARLEQLWRHEATWSQVLTHTQRIRIVEDALRGFCGARNLRPVTLRMTVTSLAGEVRPVLATRGDPNKIYPDDPGRAPHTRYEETYTFTEQDLADERQQNKIAVVAVASSAIPVIFRAESVAGKGPYVDGGLVNNAPISLAIRDHDAIDRVIVVTPEPALAQPAFCLGRFSLRTLFEIMINERLARDLDGARRMNGKLAKLREVVPEETVRRTTGWRHLEVVEVRPHTTTPGGLVSGFFLPSQREQNIRLGREAANAVLKVPLTVVSAGSRGNGASRLAYKPETHARELSRRAP